MMAGDREGPESCDLVVIGGGMAGLPIANKAAYKGLRTVLVEKETLGGTCLNRGCIPTKTMIHSARVAHLVRRAGDFGVRTSAPDVDLGAVVDRKNEVVERIRNGSYRQVRNNENLELIEGEARFEPDGAVRVGGRVTRAPKVIVNVGARPAVPDIAGLDRTPYLTSRQVLDLRELPESLIVIGGGFVGIELAQMFARFGTRVTVLQRNERILPREEPEIGDALREILEEEGLSIRTEADVREVEPLDDGVRVRFRTADDVKEIDGHRLLVAAGRTPNTDALGLNGPGADVDDRGFIRVNSRFRTTAEGIYAIGDVTGRPMFTHSARDDADVLYRILVKDDTDASTDGRVVPHAVFTDPEVASVGLTEEEARQQGHEVAVGRQDFSGVARAWAMGETQGFIKLVAEADSKRLLGAHILGPSAGELIHELALGLVLDVTVDDVARTLHVHPTLAEGINAAAGGVHRPAG
ncbi:MAG: dihydrolipoyl dehydrogenase [Candidatus Longimicrobiales bacterium M2_2A_002]